MPELVAPLVQQGESPKLVKSTNTRLSKVPGTCTRAPKFTRIVQFAPGTKRWGLIPSKLAKNVISPGGISSATYTVSGNGGTLGSTEPGEGGFINTNYDTPQEAYVPARIKDAGALDAVVIESHATIGKNAISGITWVAYPTFVSQIGAFIAVTAWGNDGARFTRPIRGPYFANDRTFIRWVGITCHGAAGDYLWYQSASGVCHQKLSLSGRILSFGPEVVVVTTGQPLAGLDVISSGGNHAYLVHAQSGSTTGATLRRVDVTTGTTTHSANIAGALAGGGKCAVHYGTLSGVARVAVAFARVSGAKTTVALYSDVLSTIGAPVEVSGYGDVAVGFYEDAQPGAHEVMAVVSATQGSGAAIAATSTGAIGSTVFTMPVATWGSSISTRDFPWLILQSHLLHWQRGADQFPIFLLGRSYGDVDDEAGGANYVDDPSITAYIWGRRFPRPVARFGVVRGSVAPAHTAAMACLSSRSSFMAGDEFTCAYRKQPQPFDPIAGSTTPDDLTYARYVTVDLSPHQPVIAHDKDGGALIAGAAPAQFDGNAFADLGGPYHAPKLYFLYSGSNALPAGSYTYAASYEWTDNAGNVHRSRISNILNANITGPSSPNYALKATTADGFIARDFGVITVSFYANASNDKGLHLLQKTTVAGQGFALASSSLIDAPADAANPQIYSTGSDGEELLPQPAPPLRDIVTIGPRAWGIDGEVPTRIVPSKLRVAGVGYEFSPFLEINLPSDAGDGMAIRDWQGLAVVLCQRGVYQIAGDGPNNNLSGGEFSQPIKISDIPCTVGPSAVSFPGGIIWQSGQRFAMLSGGGVDFLPNFNATYDVLFAMLQRRYEEILFFSNTTAEVRVYNYSVGRWTTWDSQVLEAPVTAAALLPYNEDQALLYSESSGFMYRLDADSVSDCANMTWKTDWTLLGGDFQDHVLIRDVILNGTILGPHSITIELSCDYETTPSTVRTWSASELDAIDNNGRYTVRLDPKEINCRAVELKIYDTVAVSEVDRRGVQPRSLTLVYAIDGMLYETVFVEGSRK